MKFMILFRGERDDIPACKSLAEMGTLMEELTLTGQLLGSEGLYPTTHGARVKVSPEKTSVIDGPFAEAKELIAGFALVNVGSKQAAVDLAQRFLRIAGEGSAEVRQVIEATG